MPDDVELIWNRSLDVPPPWRMAVLLLLAVLVVGKLLPWAIRAVSGLVRQAVRPSVAILLLPEYLLTSWRREQGRPPLWGTHAYNNGVERAAILLSRASRRASRTLGRRRKIPWGRVVLVALVPALLWYTGLYLPDNRVTHPVVELVGSTQRPLLVADTWVQQMSGVPPALADERLKSAVAASRKPPDCEKPAPPKKKNKK